MNWIKTKISELKAKAKKIFKMIVDDESTTPGGRVRSGQMLDYLEK